MAEVQLVGRTRTEFGKGASRRLRREGQVPAVLYGDGAEPRHLSVDAHSLNQALRQSKVILEIELDGDTFPCAPRDVQRDAIRHDLKHVDLIALDRAALKERQIEADALARAEQAAVDNELDPVLVSEAVIEFLAEGVAADVVVDQAVEKVQADLKAQAEAAAAAAAAEDAAEAEGASAAEESEGETAEESAE